MWRARLVTLNQGLHLNLKKESYFLKNLRPLATEPILNSQTSQKSLALRVVQLLGLGLPAVGAGIIGFAWYDADFKRQLQNSFPFVKDYLGKILPENEKSSLVPRKPSPEPRIPQIKAFTNIPKEVAQQAAPCRIEPEPESAAEKYAVASPTVVPQQIEESVVVPTVPPSYKEEDDRANSSALETTISKLLSQSEHLVIEAVNAQVNAAISIRNYGRLLKRALDKDPNDALDVKALWEAVAAAQLEREQAVTSASEQVAQSKKCMEKLKDVIHEGTASPVTQNNASLSEASKRLNDFVRELGSVNMQVRQAEAEVSFVQKYQELLEKGRRQFQKEVEIIVPKAGPDLQLTEDELNALIAHAVRRIEQLQKQIAELQALEKEKFISALEAQKIEDRRITSISVSEEQKSLRHQFEVEKSKLIEEYQTKLEDEVRKQLARQAAAHNDHLKEMLSLQEQHLMRQFNTRLQHHILEERENFQKEVASWISRVKGIDAAVDARAAQEEMMREAQRLWHSCMSLNSLVYLGGTDEDHKSLHPLGSYVDAILQAGRKYPAVQTLSYSIPAPALTEGVSTEEELKERFSRVARICCRVGLVNEANASLFTYLISYLNSLLVVANEVNMTENEDIDLATLDTFSLLDYAKFWVEKGNLDLALRFMNQLNGEPSQAASDWIKDTVLFLETKQVAKTLTAYVAASGAVKTF